MKSIPSLNRHRKKKKMSLFLVTQTIFPLESLVSPIDSSFEGEKETSSPSDENNQKDFESGLHGFEHQ